jgi:hypothetical protein
MYSEYINPIWPRSQIGLLASRGPAGQQAIWVFVLHVVTWAPSLPVYTKHVACKGGLE